MCRGPVFWSELIVFIPHNQNLGSRSPSFFISFLFPHFLPRNEADKVLLTVWIKIGERNPGMGFFVTSLIFVVVGIIASLCTRICCNRGPSTNLFHLTLVITATVCCWMMWAIVYIAQMKPLIVPILSEGE